MNLLLISNNHKSGIYTLDSDLNASNIVVSYTKSKPETLNHGYGLQSLNASSIDCQQCVFNENRVFGIGGLSENTKISLQNLIIKNTKSKKADYRWGMGILAQNGARFSINNALLENNRLCGIVSYDNNSSMNILNTIINNTKKQKCSETDILENLQCKSEDGGVGLASYSNSIINIENVRILNSFLIGLQITDQSIVLGNNVEISYSQIGINIYNISDEYDIYNSISNLKMIDNDLNITEDITLHVPSPDDI